MHGLSFINWSINIGTYWSQQRKKRKARDKEWKRSLQKDEVAKELTSQHKEMLGEFEKQIEHPKKSSRKCPECQRSFFIVKVGDVDVDYCPMCGGSWFDPGELALLAQTDEDVPGKHLKSRLSRFNCPQCGLRMIEHVYKLPFNLLVDQCPLGHGIYLENQEVRRAFEISED